jgi:hypothetical protein
MYGAMIESGETGFNRQGKATPDSIVSEGSPTGGAAVISVSAVSGTDVQAAISRKTKQLVYLKRFK